MRFHSLCLPLRLQASHLLQHPIHAPVRNQVHASTHLDASHTFRSLLYHLPPELQRRSRFVPPASTPKRPVVCSDSARLYAALLVTTLLSDTYETIAEKNTTRARGGALLRQATSLHKDLQQTVQKVSTRAPYGLTVTLSCLGTRPRRENLQVEQKQALGIRICLC